MGLGARIDFFSGGAPGGWRWELFAALFEGSGVVEFLQFQRVLAQHPGIPTAGTSRGSPTFNPAAFPAFPAAGNSLNSLLRQGRGLNPARPGVPRAENNSSWKKNKSRAGEFPGGNSSSPKKSELDQSRIILRPLNLGHLLSQRGLWV